MSRRRSTHMRLPSAPTNRSSRTRCSSRPRPSKSSRTRIPSSSFGKYPSRTWNRNHRTYHRSNLARGTPLRSCTTTRRRRSYHTNLIGAQGKGERGRESARESARERRVSSWRPFPKGGSGCGRESAGTNVWARATRTRVLVVVAVAVAATFRFITRTQRGSVRGVGHGARRIFREVREGDFRAVRGRIGARERVVGRATVRRPAVESGSSVVVRVNVPSVRGLAITARIIRATVLFVHLPVAAEPPAVRAAICL